LAEQLEPRRLLAGIEAGVLVARGTESGDTISIRRSGIDDVIVTTNGVNQTFDMDNFTGVRLEGLGGNDTFNMIDALVSPLVRNTTILGGGGEDTVDYSARIAALNFDGYQQPHSATPLPYVRVTFGAQQDRVDNTVERFIGGSASDMFTFDGFAIDDAFSKPALTLEGRGGDDVFNHVADLTVTMYGGGGNDQFEADDERTQFTAIFAGAGNDRIGFDNEGSPAFLDAGAGLDTILLSGFVTSHLDVIDISGYDGLENVEGVGAGGGTKTVIGNALNNRITAAPSAEDAMTLLGGGGNDTLTGGPAADSLAGGEGNDSLLGNGGDDTIDGGDGFDTVDGGPGNDVITNAEVTPAAPNIRISNRILIADGSWGQDLITIERTGTDDVIVRVNDVSRTFDMDNFDGVLLRGNAGWDELRVLQPIVAGSLVRKVTLEGGAGNDTFFGSTGDEVIRGGDGDDFADGLAGKDALFGGSGNDEMFHFSGGDSLLDGGDGNDRLVAGGNTPGDTVIGGNGNDTAAVDPGDSVSGVETFE
jgi:Ca2+-binding RTX toxin-like protein